MKTNSPKQIIARTAIALTFSAICAMNTAMAADNTKYSPTAKVLNVTSNVTNAATDTYTLTITSPADLNKPFPEPNVIVPVSVTSTDVGAPSVSADSVTFTALNQAQNTTVTVNTTGALEGTYSYTISGDGPNGYGWGNSGASLTVNVGAPDNDPDEVDTTPPEITINSPAENSSFIIGTNVSIQFEATEDLSPITAVSASVSGGSVTLATVGSLPVTFNGNTGDSVINATGSVNPSLIGTYTLTANATSAGGVAENLRDFTINYDMSNGWLPPISLGKVSKGGSTVPIKFTVKDANGAFVNDNSVKVVVYEGLDNQFESVFGDGSTGIRIDPVAGQYITNFKTATGSHYYRADVFFLDHTGNYLLQGSKAFSTK
jgi:hypothetical protein